MHTTYWPITIIIIITTTCVQSILVLTYWHVDTLWRVLSQTLLQSVSEPNFQTTDVIRYRRLALCRHARCVPSGASVCLWCLKVTVNTLSSTVTDLYWRRILSLSTGLCRLSPLRIQRSFKLRLIRVRVRILPHVRTPWRQL